MKKIIVKVVKFSLFLSIGIILFWWAYRDQNIDEIVNALKNANFFWIGASLVFGFLSHLSRAMRWNLMLQPLGYNPRISNTLFAVFVMYLANIAFPRLGEVSRCGIMKRYEKVQLSQALGTVFIERIVDFILLVLLLAVVLIAQFQQIFAFLRDNVSHKFANIIVSSQSFIAVSIFGIVAVFLFIIFRKKLQATSLYRKIEDIFLDFIEGIKTIKTLENRTAFIAHSLFIYLMYFLMIYVCFFAFDFTSHLSAMVGLTVFVLASFGMVAPSPGGIGTWHIMAIGTLLIYQISESHAKAFAFAAHGSMTLFLIVAGFVSLILLPVTNKNTQKS